MGGGGFSMEPDNPLLDDFLLSLVPHDGRPRVCFVPTASGDAEAYIEKFRAAFPSERAEASVLSLFSREEPDLPAFLAKQDVVYVGGGSTANLLAVWRLHGLDTALREAMANGLVVAGLSAGMNCWFEASVTDSFDVNRLQPLGDGLGLVAGSACPHYDGEEDRRPTYLHLVGDGRLPDGYAADDGCGLLFRDGTFVEAVSSRPHARAFAVRRTADGAVEEPLPVRYLG
jgi:dipeptidase E